MVGDRGGPITFKVDQSATSDDVVQLAGIYTVPEARRAGLASAGVAAVCAQLMESRPMVTLYVDRNNTAAVRLYQKLGFEAVGTIRSVWFEI